MTRMGTGIVDAAASVPWTGVTGRPTTLAGYGIGDAVPASRTLSAGAGLAGGGTLAADRTLSLAASGVTAASYGSATGVPVISVDAYGRITSASAVTGHARLEQHHR